MSTPAGEPDGLPSGALAGPWRIERELGRGGMGTVYAVVHTEIGKQAALKLVHKRVQTPNDRMLLEAQVVNQIDHPNIVDIFEVGHLPDGRPYLVMERLDGQPLSHRADSGIIPAPMALSILLQICDALIAAHAAGIIHRDLKLDNVFLVDNPEEPATPRIKLLDWGIAKVVDAVSPRCTIDGQLVGTPQYLAPEQARGGPVSSKTDVYSLGVMAYEMFAQQLPFEAETAAEIMTMHLRATPPPASDWWPDIPPKLEDLIHEMLAKNPLHRPTMLEVAQRLDEVRTDLLAQHMTPDPTLPKAEPLSTSAAIDVEVPQTRNFLVRRRWQWAVGAGALAATVALFLISQILDTAAAAEAAVSEAAVVLPAPKPIPLPVAAAPVSLVHEVPIAATPVATRVAPAAPAARPRLAIRRLPAPLPATPRRNARIDPDGTYDPYR